MNRISERSFIALMLTADAFPLICITGRISLLTAAGFLIGILLQAILALPLAHMYRHGSTLSSCGRSVCLIYLLIIVSWGALLFDMLWHTSGTVYIPYENNGAAGRFIIALCIAAVCLYITISGLTALSRSVAFAAFASVMLLIIFAVSTVLRADLNSLKEVHSSGSILTETERGIALSGGTGSLAVLLGHTKGDPVRITVRCFLAKAAVWTVMLLTVLLTAAPVMDISEFPAVMAAQISQPFPSQRIDSLFMIVFSCLAVYSAAVQTVSASLIAGELMSSLRRYVPAAVLLLMTAGALLFEHSETTSPFIAAMSISALILLPAVNAARKKMRIENV